MEYSAETRYPSSIADGGHVQWASFEAKSVGEASKKCSASIRVDFDTVNWSLVQKVYGWSVTQCQAWVRGTLELSHPNNQPIELLLDGVLEFEVDGVPYFGGDMNGLRKAPVILHLDPGTHRLDIRLIHDVRSMGGIKEPILKAQIQASICKEALDIDADKVVAPEIVNGRLPSSWSSIPVRNSSRRLIEVTRIKGIVFGQDESEPLSISDSDVQFSIHAGQTRPLPCHLECEGRAANKPVSVIYKIYYVFAEPPRRHGFVATRYKFGRTGIACPHKITFLHPSGCVSYAIVRPPSPKSYGKDPRTQRLPIMLCLHGAGLDVNDPEARKMLDMVSKLPAWTLLPSGMTPWSGDDWHTWGFSDVLAAVQAIPRWIHQTKWDGPGVDVDEWLVCGHSNGGQGVWHALTHFPGKIIGAAPVSGYSSIQSYVPYHLWTEVEPQAMAVIHNALSSYRYELLCPNLADIPIYQQHGSADDNVPAYQSRRMHQLISQGISNARYSEAEWKGHWYPGVMTTPELADFYEKVLHNPIQPPIPADFSIVIPRSTDVISIFGLEVDQLVSPGRCGTMDVSIKPKTKECFLKSSNIHRFHFNRRPLPPSWQIYIDGHQIDSAILSDVHTSLVLYSVARWTGEQESEWKTLEQRYGRQNGSMDAILRTQGAFEIVGQSQDQATHDLALQISRNLFQYFSADARLHLDGVAPMASRSNVITLVLGVDPSPTVTSSFPITVSTRGIDLYRVIDARELFASYRPQEGLGLITLRPLPDERLELLIWGYDEAGLRRAARLVPMLTGVGQPDFIIVGKEVAWKGIGGVLAMGFFDKYWQISRESYVT